jgi:hypothetical protein
MARAVAQPRNDVYTGMLILICISMLVGIFVLVLEAGEYEWAQEPPSSPPLALPKSEPLPLEAGSVPAADTQAEPTRGPVAVTPEGDELPEPTVPAKSPALPDVLSGLPTVTAEAPKSDVPSGPTPSPLSVPVPTRPNVAPHSPTPSPLTVPPSRR